MAILEEISTISAKGQTTIPKAVRTILGVGVGDKIVFQVDGERVTLASIREASEDPVIGGFLEFIVKDIQKRPGAIKALSREFAAKITWLTKGKRLDREVPIEGPVDL